MNDTPSRFNKFLSSATRTVCLWLFGDVIYAVLPIIVLAVITLLLGESFHEFFRLKEWSFATIVFFGVAIRKLVRLKVEIQQTPRSFKLDTGLQFFVICLVISVLVLSLVILDEKHALQPRVSDYLAHAQVTLFLTGLVSLLLCVQAEDIAPRC